MNRLLFTFAMFQIVLIKSCTSVSTLGEEILKKSELSVCFDTSKFQCKIREIVESKDDSIQAIIDEEKIPVLDEEFRGNILASTKSYTERIKSEIQDMFVVKTISGTGILKGFVHSIISDGYLMEICDEEIWISIYTDTFKNIRELQVFWNKGRNERLVERFFYLSDKIVFAERLQDRGYPGQWNSMEYTTQLEGRFFHGNTLIAVVNASANPNSEQISGPDETELSRSNKILRTAYHLLNIGYHLLSREELKCARRSADYHGGKDYLEDHFKKVYPWQDFNKNVPSKCILNANFKILIDRKGRCTITNAQIDVQNCDSSLEVKEYFQRNCEKILESTQWQAASSNCAAIESLAMLRISYSTKFGFKVMELTFN